MATMQTTMNLDVESKDKATELLWQDALRHLESTNNEVLLPVNVADQIGQSNVDKIRSRLCALIGAPAVAFVDESINALRIMRTPTFSGSAISVASPDAVTKPGTDSAAVSKKCPGKPAVQSKAAKVPRPPNAFILYRQYHHPKIKAAHPDFHNNDISIMLGKQWKSEPDEVKAHYKHLADEMKRKHAAEHPDYQYAPRKPSEKKRRASSRQYPKHQISTALLDSPSPTTATSVASTPAVQHSMNFANFAAGNMMDGDFVPADMMVNSGRVVNGSYTLQDAAFDLLVQQMQQNEDKSGYCQLNGLGLGLGIGQQVAEAFEFTDFLSDVY